jgi:hypothetical protein
VNIQQAKQIHCLDYMHSLGYKEVRTQNGTHGLEYVFQSPLRDDTKPSLCINIPQNVWSDVPMGEGGNILDLACYLYGYAKGDIREALRILSGFRGVKQIDLKQNLSIVNQSSLTSLKEKESKNTILNIKPLFSYPLKNYLEQERKIPLSIANTYVKEVEYQIETGQKFYGISFQSGEAYAIRSKTFKGFVGTGANISVFSTETPLVLIFEGFMDFLSYLTVKELTEAKYTVIVLNSSVFIKRAITEIQSNYKNTTHIHYFRDRDEINNKTAGIQSLELLKTKLPHIKIIDESEKYKDFKDLNDWLIANF